MVWKIHFFLIYRQGLVTAYNEDNFAKAIFFKTCKNAKIR